MPKDDMFLVAPVVAAFEVLAIEKSDTAHLEARCRLCGGRIQWESVGWVEKTIVDMLTEMSKHECEDFNVG